VIPYRQGNMTLYAIVLVKDRIGTGEYQKPEGVGYDLLKERAAAEQYREALEKYMDGLRKSTTVYVDSDAIAKLDAEAVRTEQEIENPVPILEDQ
jgi:hypothetical protein